MGWFADWFKSKEEKAAEEAAVLKEALEKERNRVRTKGYDVRLVSGAPANQKIARRARAK